MWSSNKRLGERYWCFVITLLTKLITERVERFIPPSRASHFCLGKSTQNRSPRLSGSAAPSSFAPAVLRGATAKGYP